MPRIFFAGVVSVLAAGVCLPLAAQVNVLTYQYGNARLGLNPNETNLTRANVNPGQFGKLFAYPVDGDIYGQPLYLAGVNIAGKGVHNAVYVATEHDSVYAFDADSGVGPNSAPLWQVSFIDPAAGVTTVPAADVLCGQIFPEIGITSTPVIDPAGGAIYVVAMTKESGRYVQRLHALDVTSGAEKPGSPVAIQASYPGTGEGGSTVVFNPKNYKQRPGLLLLNGVVYTAWSSHCDIGAYHGWLIGYDAKTLQQVSVYNTTPNGNGASFWASGAAPASDDAGYIYLVAGNGTFDYASGGPDLGEGFIKLSTSGGLKVADWFAPFNYADLNARDVDTGSSGVALLPDEAGSAAHPHLMTSAGKEGRIYVLDRDNLGHFNANFDPIVQSIPNAVGPLFGNPAYFSKTVYYCGAYDTLKAFPIANAALATTPASQSQAQFNFPGCVPSVSANGTSNGIVWVLDPAAVLRAYDASNVGSELYNSNRNAARDALGSYVKFSVPTVANGKVYAGTQNALAVYGLLNSDALTVTNAASGQQNAIAPGAAISIYGTNLAQTTAQASGFPLPATLGGASVTVAGITAPLYFASPVQINAQVPYEVPAGTAAVAVRVGSQPAGSANVSIQPAAPGIFLLQQNRAAALNQDGSTNAPNRPAAAGSVIAVYATGLGALDNPVATGAAAPSNPLSRAKADVTATIAGQTAQVLYAGLAPGFAGLYQVNVVVPQVASGDAPLQVTAAGVASNTATISIQ
jgi:uncharacterized protein (TIGR03437 family)